MAILLWLLFQIWFSYTRDSRLQWSELETLGFNYLNGSINSIKWNGEWYNAALLNSQFVLVLLLPATQLLFVMVPRPKTELISTHLRQRTPSCHKKWATRSRYCPSRNRLWNKLNNEWRSRGVEATKCTASPPTSASLLRPLASWLLCLMMGPGF